MIKLFEQFNNNQEIHDICKEYDIDRYTINGDNSIDVNGDVYINDLFIEEKLPLKFNIVYGNFNITNNYISTLEGCPKRVYGYFSCASNSLTDLKGCPEYIEGDCYVGNNDISNLKYSPKYIGGNFNCSNCYITSLNGFPEFVGKDVDCGFNRLTDLIGVNSVINGDFIVCNNMLETLKGCPNEINGIFNFLNNRLKVIDVEVSVKSDMIFFDFMTKIEDIKKYGLLNKFLEYGLDYNVFNDDGSINKSRINFFINDYMEDSYFGKT